MSKPFGVRFYAASIYPSTALITPPSFFDLCHDEAMRQAHGATPTKVQIGAECSELRNLHIGDNGDWIRGVMAKLRVDAPNVRLADGGESGLELNEGESLLEKNHFLLYKRTGLLVWQMNGAANHQSRMCRLVEALSGQQGVAVLDDVLSYNAVQALNSGNLRMVEVKLRCPNEQVHDAYDFGGGALAQLVETAPGAHLTVNFTVGKRKTPLPSSFTGWVRGMIPGAQDGGDVERLCVRTDEHSQPIDLIAETVKDTVQVNMIGRYPDMEVMFSKLNESMIRKRHDIDAFFQSNSVLE